MAKIVMNIPAISCQHCLMNIKRSLIKLEGVKNVEGDLPSKTVAVEYTAPANDKLIKQTLAEIGYPVEEAHVA